MAYNTKYGLKYPGGEDYYNVEDFNKNFSTISDEIYETNTKIDKETSERKVLSDIVNNRTGYAVCSTSGNIAAKTVTCAGVSLVKGASIKIRFQTINTASSPTLNVNNLGAKPIIHNQGYYNDLYAGNIYEFIYDGSYWCLVGSYSIVNTVRGDKEVPVTSKAVYDEMVKKQGKFTYLVAVKNKVNSDGSCDCDSSYINAADYVFDCTGATASSYTSTEGLNKFLKSLPLGSKVVFAPGSYLISNTIQVDTRLYLEGLNHMATFFTINDIVMLNIGDGINQASNVTVRNIYFRKWDFDSIPPTQENKSSRVFTKPVINVTKGNGVYIEKCGFYSHSNGYNAQNGYNSLVRYNDYCMNSVVEKCTLNTNVHYLINNGKRAGFTIDLANCDGTVASISIKFIANFGSITCYKPKSISSYETTFIGCTGVQEYNEDSVAVNALNSDEIEEV